MKLMENHEKSPEEKYGVEGYSWLIIKPGYMGGQPAIRGRRFSVDLILTFLSQGMTPAEIAEDYELPIEAVLECITFARGEVAKRRLGPS